MSKIYFRIKEGRVKRDIYTKIHWPRQYFDRVNQQLLFRWPEDPDVIPNNLKLNEYKAIAHRLQLSGYLKENQVTIVGLFLPIAARSLRMTGGSYQGTLTGTHWNCW